MVNYYSKYFLLIFLVLTLNPTYSSAEIRISSSYTPSSSTIGNGLVNIGNFDYIQDGLYFNEKKNSYCAKNKYIEMRELVEQDYCFNEHEIIKYVFHDESNYYNYERSGYFLDDEIKKYIKKAVVNEFKFIGFDLSKKADLKISGVLRSFIFDVSSVKNGKMVVKIDFTISDRKGKSIYEKESLGMFMFSSLYPDMSYRLIDVTSAIYSATSRAIEDFVKSAQAEGFLGYGN